jgi:hypothetical protein
MSAIEEKLPKADILPVYNVAAPAKLAGATGNQTSFQNTILVWPGA